MPVTKLIPFLALWLISTMSFSQVPFRTASFESKTLEEAPQLIVKQLSVKYHHEVELHRAYTRKSRVGTHRTFEIQVAGLGIHGMEVKLNLFDDGSATFSYPELDLSAIGSTDHNRSMTQPALTGYDQVLKSKRAWVMVDGMLQQAQVYKVLRGIEVVEVIVDQDGEILREFTLNRHVKADSTVAAQVFLPDPITSSETEYSYPLADNNDQNSPELIATMVIDSTAVRWDSSLAVWTLQSDYAIASDLSAPFGDPPTSASGQFIFNRSQLEFEFVNAYYHLNRQHKRLESLGYGSVSSYAIPFDAHGTEDDQSSFLPTGDTNGVLIFGDGGIDDAEDADVIVHEYGHSFVYSVAPETSNGDERLAIEEAVCDFFALGYSRELSEFGYDRLFNWDGNTSDWHGRQVSATATYPSDLDNYNDGKYDIYKSSIIWSSALADVYDLFGREVSEKLLLTSLYSYYSFMTMTDAAQLYLKADSLLYGAEHADDISIVFCYRGLLDGCQDTLLSQKPVGQPYLAGLEDFAYNGGELRLFSNGFEVVELQLFSVRGELIFNQELTDNETTPLFLILNLPIESSGLYILRVMTTEGDYSIKIMRNM